MEGKSPLWKVKMLPEMTFAQNVQDANKIPLGVLQHGLQ